MNVLLGIGGLALTVLGFVFGRIFSQSEAILAEKRRVYEQFLVKCPMAIEAYREFDPDAKSLTFDLINEEFGRLMLYASQDVIFSVQIYMELLQKADMALSPKSPADAPEYNEAARAQNDIVLEMRRDALAWSTFGHRAKTRLPEDRLERAMELTK